MSDRVGAAAAGGHQDDVESYLTSQCILVQCIQRPPRIGKSILSPPPEKNTTFFKTLTKPAEGRRNWAFSPP